MLHSIRSKTRRITIEMITFCTIQLQDGIQDETWEVKCTMDKSFTVATFRDEREAIDYAKTINKLADMWRISRGGKKID